MTLYNLTLEGKGGDIYGGKLRRKDYEYLKANQIDMEEYINGETVDEDDEDFDMWDKLIDYKQCKIFAPTEPDTCDNLYHNHGIFLDSLSNGGITIKLKTLINQVVWEKTYETDDIEQEGIRLDPICEVDFNKQRKGTAILHGSTMNGDWLHQLLLPLDDGDEFDPSKIVIILAKLGFKYLIVGVGYDMSELYGDTSFNGNMGDDTAEWFIVGGEEWYESISIYDRNL
jgi:hypothetical protein